MYLSRVIHSKGGKIIMSILLGFGLATLFRKTCDKQNCLVFEAPPLEEVEKTVYKFNNDCYHFTPRATTCSSQKKTVLFA